MTILAANPAFNFFDFFDAVMGSSASTTEKLLALIIGRHVGRNGAPAFPSRMRISEQAGCSMSTFKRAQPALRSFFDVEERKGRTTHYAPKPVSKQTRVQNDTRCQNDTITRAQNDTHPGVKMTPHKDSLNGPLKVEVESSLRSDSTARVRPVPDDPTPSRPKAGAVIGLAMASMVAAAPLAAEPQQLNLLQVETAAQQSPAMKVPPIDQGKRKRKSAREYTKEFEYFWELYPNGVGKGNAFDAWQKLTLNQQRQAWIALKGQLNWLKQQHDRGFCAHASTWLNGRRFDDKPVTHRPERQSNYSANGEYVGPTL